MEFTLYYRGELKSNGSPKDKHNIRNSLSPQLELLWSLDPLVRCKDYIKPLSDESRTKNENLCLIEEVGDHYFAAFISEKLFLNAELVITMLRPQAPGNIIMQSGDIDNRLKTLFDALSVPAQENQIPNNIAINNPNNPIYCLLQDDRLISSVHVKTDRLLDPNATEKEVVLLIHIKTKVTKHIWANTTFI